MQKQYVTEITFERLREKIDHYMKVYSEIHWAEIFEVANNAMEAEFEEGFIKRSHQDFLAGIGIRCIGESGKQGTSYTSDLSDLALEETVKNCVKMMKIATLNPDFKDLAIPSKSYKQVEKLYDSKIPKLTFDELGDALNPIFELKHMELPPISLSGGIYSIESKIYIWNSNGIELYDKGTATGARVMLNLQQNKIVANGYDGDSVVHWNELNVQKIATSAYNMAKKGLTKTTIPTGKYPILFSPRGVDSFLMESILPALNAEAIQNNLSFFAHKLNQKIGNSLLTIFDDPHIPNKIHSRAFDDEGIATQPLTIIEKGVLKKIYHNTLTAGKENKTSNGHAYRSSYSSNIGIMPYNIRIEAGEYHWQDILKDIKLGIYFESSGDSPNKITGDFSGLISTGFLIKDGEITSALQETMIGINLFDAMKQISKISKEREWRGCCYLPHIQIDNVSITSR